MLSLMSRVNLLVMSFSADSPSIDLGLVSRSLLNYLLCLENYQACVDKGQIPFDQHYYDYLVKKIAFYERISLRYS